MAHPQNVDFKDGLSDSYYQLGEIFLNTKDRPQAKEYLLQAEHLWSELVRDVPLHVEYQDNLKEVQKTAPIIRLILAQLIV